MIAGAASGLAAWATSANGSIIGGASGLVYGYIGYTMARGLFDHRPGPIAKSILSTALFAGSLSGLVPGMEAISWQGHLGGFIGGVAAAALLPKEP